MVAEPVWRRDGISGFTFSIRGMVELTPAKKANLIKSGGSFSSPSLNANATSMVANSRSN